VKIDVMTHEHDTLKQCQAGDPTAFRTLYDRYVGSSWRTACGILGDNALAEDAVQEAFVRVFRSIGQVDTSRPFGAWLKRIVVNESLRCANWRKRGGQPGEIPEREAPEVTEEIIDAAERAQVIEASLSDLPDELRVLVVLKYFDDMSDPQIASATDTPVGTVKSRLARARARLRDSCRQRGIDLDLKEV
jgi:RNA polymerase sigma-70 factor, ECF subfamily